MLPYTPVRRPNLQHATLGRMNEGPRGEATLGGATERLLGSDEPAVRYRVLTKVLGREPASVAILRKLTANEFVTADALYVLKESGR